MLSLPHLIVLFVIALVIFGPQKLPELARILGKATAEFRRITNDFRYTLEDEVRNLERETRIHQEEIAAAARAVEPPPAPPQGTMPRELPAWEAPVETAPEPPPQAEAGPALPETVTAPQEKPSDDTAV
jgi:sec-independent protein translocase protein TatB